MIALIGTGNQVRDTGDTIQGRGFGGTERGDEEKRKLQVKRGALTAIICQNIPSAGECGGGTTGWRGEETVPAGRGTDC